ncbi:MAG: flagellar filament capping protein FliD [Anaerovoracaceae bacterium]|jgi:flagellar hook-associated protein 2
MSPVNSISNSSNVSPLSIKTGIGGLVSGMDIDDLVESLTASSRAKLAKQQQIIQKLQWQQTAYRSVTTALNGFKNKFLNVLSATNFKSASFFNTTSASASLDAVSVSSTSSAAAGSFTINSIERLATNQTVETATHVSKALTSSKTIGEIVGDLKAGDFINLNLDGKVKVINFDSNFIDSLDESNFSPKFQALLDDAFGFTDDSDRIIKVSVDDTGHMVLNATGSTLTINAVGKNNEAVETLGFKGGQSNKVNLNMPLDRQALNTELEGEEQEIVINGESFTFKSTDSLRTIMEEINSSKAGVTMSYSSITDKFTLTAKESGSGENIKITQISGNLMEALGLTGDNAKVTAGENAVLTVNGQKVIRSSNNVDIDGVKVTLNRLSSEEITVNVKNDATALTEPIKNFVEEYNTLMDLMNGLTKEKVEKNYPPLTDAQKAEMTETQIKDWEAKAKSGILRSDPLLGKILTSMNSVITGLSIDGFSLYSMGISTTGYGGGGKLQIDEDKLKDALENHGDKVRALFTSPEGVSYELDKIIVGATKTTGEKGTRGSLIEAAGAENTRSDSENSIYERIKRANKSIESLKARLIREEAMHWKKFTHMETILNNLNAQSMLLLSFSDQ